MHGAFSRPGSITQAQGAQTAFKHGLVLVRVYIYVWHLANTRTSAHVVCYRVPRVPWLVYVCCCLLVGPSDGGII